MSDERVHNPQGDPPAVTGQSMASRPNSLDGRRLFIVDPRFDDGSLVLRHIETWFARNMPGVDAEYVELEGNYLHDFDDVWSRIRDANGAAIIGVGHCSTCAPAVAKHAIALESKYGVPTVAIHTQMFERVVRSVCLVNGMPDQRRVFVPHPVIGRSEEEVAGYVAGEDPTTGRGVMDSILEGLTGAIAAQAPAVLDRATPRFVDAAAGTDFDALFLERGWTDQLPIVVPTESRVAAMLAGTSHAPDEVVGELRPTDSRESWSFTVERVAVNAVMAGARPEYLPVLLALASSGVTARPSSTSSASAMVVVNGPIRNEIGMNSGLGALGPYNHANAAIGRAYGLLSANLQGGSEPGVTYMGTLGNGFSYNSLCFAENEEQSPWEPLHVEHGHAADASVLWVAQGSAYMSTTLSVTDEWEAHTRAMLLAVDPALSRPTFLLDPLAARGFVERGLTTKDDLREWAWRAAHKPAREYWAYHAVKNYVYPEAASGVEPWASRLNVPDDTLVPPFEREEIGIVVVGGGTKPYWGIGGCGHHTQWPAMSASISIDAWR